MIIVVHFDSNSDRFHSWDDFFHQRNHSVSQRLLSRLLNHLSDIILSLLKCTNGTIFDISLYKIKSIVIVYCAIMCLIMCAIVSSYPSLFSIAVFFLSLIEYTRPIVCARQSVYLVGPSSWLYFPLFELKQYVIHVGLADSRCTSTVSIQFQGIFLIQIYSLFN